MTSLFSLLLLGVVSLSACGDSDPGADAAAPVWDTWKAQDIPTRSGVDTFVAPAPADTGSPSMPDSILPPKDSAQPPADTAAPPTPDTTAPPQNPGSCVGRCDQFDQAFDCQCDMACYDGAGTDCCADYATACKADDGAYETCLKTQCGSNVAACLNNAVCFDAFMCLVGCGGDVLCAKACEKNLSGLNKTKFDNVISCGQDKGC